MSKLIKTNILSQCKVILITTNQFYSYSKYLNFFPNDVQEDINGFLHHRDRVTAFTSAILKYYYLPALLNVKPIEIQIRVNRYGKPYLQSHPEIDFSISHSGEYVVLGVAFGKKIGIDIELIDKGIDLKMKSIVFNEFESKLINDYNDFFILWVKMEAYLKCLGVGFTENVGNLNLNTDLVQRIGDFRIETFILKNNLELPVCISICMQID